MKPGINLGDLLLASFIVLKLIGEIHWSWIWVLSPFWIGILLTVVIGLHKDSKEEKKKKSLWAERMEEMKNKKL